ncbi:MAG TPA: protein kinase [Candidatus Limnocylindrales bacterium]|nr:protein kinase [Candidatus Limnocylindrales bacterium]
MRCGVAEDVAATLRHDTALRALITAICEGLREPHQHGWIHRDLKPANILRLDGRWVVADWGLGRRPRGKTTMPGRTQVGELYGTLGYAAPELYTDAHGVGPQTDIFSIGQIIGWALLQTEPRANVPHLPATGPWRAVVEATTHQDPQLRPATVDELLSVIAAELDRPQERSALTLQRGTPVVRSEAVGLRVSTAALAEFNFYLDPEVLINTTIELLRADDDIPIRRLLRNGVPEVRALYRIGDQQATHQILDHLTCLAATFLDLERTTWFNRTIDVLVSIYGIAFDNEAEIINQPTRSAAELWLAISTRAEALGALAVRREDWTAVAYLASRRVSGMHRMYVSWLKHATTMANRSELLATNDGAGGRDVSVISLARELLRRLNYLVDLDPDDDRILTSLTQFDFLACLHAVLASGDTTNASGVFYPHFASFYGTRTQPIVQRLLTDPTLRGQIYPHDDRKLADALMLVDKYAKQVGFRYDGWEGYTPDVIDFIRSNLGATHVS